LLRTATAGNENPIRKAENQRAGDWNLVFLDVNDALRPSIKIKEPKRGQIRLTPASSQRDRIGRDPVFDALENLHQRLDVLEGAVNVLRPSLNDKEQRILEFCLLENGLLTEITEQLGISKGYASKISKKIVARLGEEMAKIKPPQQ